MEQPGKEAELLWLSILTSAELGLSQTPERNFWSSISFSWGELLHRNTTRTSSCSALGQPQKRRAISQQPNLFPKPGKHLEREKLWFFLLPLPLETIPESMETNKVQTFPPSNNLPSCYPSPGCPCGFQASIPSHTMLLQRAPSASSPPELPVFQHPENKPQEKHLPLLSQGEADCFR